jgi:hypothetical protein
MNKLHSSAKKSKLKISREMYASARIVNLAIRCKKKQQQQQEEARFFDD